MAIINVVVCKTTPVFRYNYGEVLFNNKPIAPVVTFNKDKATKIQTSDLGDSVISVALLNNQPDLQNCEFALFENGDSLYFYNMYTNIASRIKINAVEFMNYAKHVCLFVDTETNTGILTCSKTDLESTCYSRKDVFQNSYFSIVFNLDNMLVYSIEPDNTDYSIDSNAYFYEIYGVNLVHTLNQDHITSDLVDKIFDVTKEVKFHEGVLFTVNTSENYYDDFSEISFDDLADVSLDDDAETEESETTETEEIEEDTEDWFDEDEEVVDDEEDEEDDEEDDEEAEDEANIADEMTNDCSIFARKGALIPKEYEVVFAAWSERIPFVNTLEFMRRYLDSENALSSEYEDCLIKLICSLIESYNYQDMHKTACFTEAEKHWATVLDMFKSDEAIKKLGTLATELIDNTFSTYINVLIYIIWHVNVAGSAFALNNVFADKLDFVAYGLIEKYFAKGIQLEDVTKYLTVKHIESVAKENNKKFKYPFKYNASLGVLDNVVNANAAYRAVAEEYESNKHTYISDVYNLVAAPNRLLRVKYFEKKKVRGRGWIDKPEFNLAFQYVYNYAQIGGSCAKEKPEKVAPKTWDAYTNLWTLMCPDYSLYLRNNFNHPYFRRSVYLLQTYHLHILSLLIPHDDLFLDPRISTEDEELKLFESIRVLCVVWQEFLSEPTFRNSTNRAIMDVMSGVYSGIVKKPELLPIYCEAYRKLYSTLKFYMLKNNNNYTAAVKQTTEILKNIILSKPISTVYRVADKLKENSWAVRLKTFTDFDLNLKVENRYISALKSVTSKEYSVAGTEVIFKLLKRYDMSDERLISAFEKHAAGEDRCIRDFLDLRSGALDFVVLAHGFAISNYADILYKPFGISTQRSDILAEAVTDLKLHPEIYENEASLNDYILNAINKHNVHNSFVAGKELAELHDLNSLFAYNLHKLSGSVMLDSGVQVNFIAVLKRCIEYYIQNYDKWGLTEYIPLWRVSDARQVAVFSVPMSTQFTPRNFDAQAASQHNISFKVLGFSNTSLLVDYPKNLNKDIAYMSVDSFFSVLMRNALDWLESDKNSAIYTHAMRLFMCLDDFLFSIALTEKDKADVRSTLRNSYFV